MRKPVLRTHGRSTTGRPSRVPDAPTFLRPASRAREHRHRRALLLGIAALLLLSLTPVVGEHLVGAARRPLTGIDHIGALCLVALHLLLAPVHTALHALVAAGALYALADRGRAWWRARRALAPLDGVIPVFGDAVWTAARVAGVPPDRLRVVDGLPTPAFTAGWLAPRVYIARALAEGPHHLAPDALAAVLAHEGAHVRRRDPLRFSALRAVAQTLFWLPALRALADGAADDAEVRADDAAAAATDPLTLAGALVALAGWRTPGSGPALAPEYPGYTVGFVRDRDPRADLLDRRVRRLAGEDTMPTARVSRRSLAGAALALVVVWTSGIVDVHALPRAVAGRNGGADASQTAAALHCFHQHASARSHLFCRHGRHGGWITPGGSDCPHRATLHRATLRPATPQQVAVHHTGVAAR